VQTAVLKNDFYRVGQGALGVSLWNQLVTCTATTVSHTLSRSVTLYLESTLNYLGSLQMVKSCQERCDVINIFLVSVHVFKSFQLFYTIITQGCSI
jgi:hypothetical protein